MTPSTTAAPTALDDLRAQAQRRVDIKMGFLVHLCVFVGVNTGLAVLQYVAGGHWHLPFPVWGWGIGLLAHGFGTVVSLMGFGLRERLLSAEMTALQKR